MCDNYKKSSLKPNTTVEESNDTYYCNPYQYETFRKYSQRIINVKDWSVKENFYFFYTSIYNARLILKDAKISCCLDYSSYGSYDGILLSKINPNQNMSDLIDFYGSDKYIQVAFAINDKDVKGYKKKALKKNKLLFINNYIDLNLCYFFIIIR